jgi:uncharacterized protein YecT (DUF1311 family)
LTAFSNTVDIARIEVSKAYDVGANMENSTSSEMIESSLKTAEELDRLLNKYYKILLNQLNDKEKQKLIASQRAWISYRDKEFEFYDKLVYGIYGYATMGPLVYQGYASKIIEERILTLANLAEASY